MDMERANATLQNVFAACDQAPNTIPFDKLVLRQKMNTRIYNRMIAITALLIALTFVSPLVIVPMANVTNDIFLPKPVSVLKDYVENDILYLQLEGDHILYGEAYMESTDGTVYAPISYDKKQGIIAFLYLSDEESNIYIPVRGAEAVHLLLTPR